MNESRREIAKRVIEQVWQRRGECVPIRVMGNSMASTLPPSSVVWVTFGTDLQLERGRIVYIRRGNLRIVHRILYSFGYFCIEKGDNNRKARLCLRSSILGIVSTLPPPTKDSSRNDPGP